MYIRIFLSLFLSLSFALSFQFLSSRSFISPISSSLNYAFSPILFPFPSSLLSTPLSSSCITFSPPQCLSHLYSSLTFFLSLSLPLSLARLLALSVHFLSSPRSLILSSSSPQLYILLFYPLPLSSCPPLPLLSPLPFYFLSSSSSPPPRLQPSSHLSLPHPSQNIDIVLRVMHKH